MLDYFFKPSSVAVIGASRDPQKIGNVVLRRLIEIGYPGRVYPVNPKAEEVMGLKSYPSIEDIPDQVDMAVIVLRADLAPRALENAAKKGVKAAIVVSGGFSEIGNVEPELEIKRISKEYGIRVIGPNCLGVYDPKNRVDTLFLPEEMIPRPHPGKVSIITQSGSLGSFLLTWIYQQGRGISKFISYGNKADVNESDLISYLAEDEDTSVIAAYIEGVDDGRRFLETLKEATRRKPVVVLKGGRTQSGDRVVRSHTGSIAGSSRVFEAAARQGGAVVVETLEEFVDVPIALASQPLPKGDRVGVITNGGGFGIIAVDSLEAKGLRVPKPSRELEEKLRAMLPPYYPVGNPTDLTGDSTPEQFLETGLAFAESGEFDVLYLIPLFGVPGMRPGEVEKALFELKSRIDIPVVAVAVPTNEVVKESLLRLEKGGIPVYSTPERASSVVKRMVELGTRLR